MLPRLQAQVPEYRLSASAYFVDSGRLAEPLDAVDYLILAVNASGSDAGSGLLARDSAASIESIRSYIMAEADSLREIASPYERANAALSALHRDKFRLYRTEQTRVDLAMEGGVYNCVSSAVIYIALAKASGLEASGVQTDDHAFATVKTERGTVDVETTNAFGFDPGNHREAFTDSFGKVTGYAYVPPEQYAKRRPVGDKAFIGLILHNRISSLEARRDFGPALSIAADYRALDQRDEILTFLMERARNVAAEFIDAGRNLEALSFLDTLESAYGPDPLIRQARSVAIQNALARYGASLSYEEGLAFVREARARWGEYPVFPEFESMTVNNRSYDLVKAGKYAQALEFLGSSLESGIGKPEDIRALKENASLAWIDATIGSSTFQASLETIRRLSANVGAAKLGMAVNKACGREANLRARADPVLGWFEAAAAFDEGLGILPGDRDLQRNKASCLDNYATAAYNRFVAAYNSGDIPRARAILEEALARHPGSQLLARQLGELKAK
jgi:tetratricopeptide (TPR) repeat protein